MLPDQVVKPDSKVQGNDPTGGMQCAGCGHIIDLTVMKITSKNGVFCSMNCAASYSDDDVEIPPGGPIVLHD